MKDHCSHLFVGFFLILLICSVPRSSMSQTPVDRLVDELDALSNVSFDNWKYTTRFTGDAEDQRREMTRQMGRAQKRSCLGGGAS